MHTILVAFVYDVAIYVFTVYSPVNKNPQFFRQRTSDKRPSLPRDGAQKMAKQISNMKNPSSQEFLKTPDAGMSGSVDLVAIFYCSIGSLICAKYI